MNRRSGFTLVELLVVIFIIAVLAGLILPVLARSRSTSRRPRCSSNLNQIAKAIFMYSDVPANRIFPTGSTTTDPYADSRPMEALNLLYRGYIVDPKVFSCRSNPVPATALERVVPTVDGKLPLGGTLLSAASCSYGYDPGHSPNDAITVLAADRQGSGSNSDNHGPNAGQNVLLGTGAVEFRESTIHPLDTDASGPSLTDSDIYSLEPSASNLPRNLDAHIRQ